jgi:hypothetical protein
MAVRNDFTAGEVLAAADLNDTFASKLDLAGGKILQVVRATDSGTTRSTTSTSFVDVTNLNVSITPQLATSSILLIATGRVQASATEDGGINAFFQITDSSNNPISGADQNVGTVNITGTGTRVVRHALTLVGFVSASGTGARTYKVRFHATSISTASFQNVFTPAQLFAIEVSA